ncbi:hypothetical protein JOC34_001244 [Virgibacillus halotolerans]|nr:hypothetical protein [Virgibacillus halotolerans]
MGLDKKGKVNGMFKNILLKWMPRKEQDVCERRLKGIMKRLKIEVSNFNWDRSSCYIEFNYQEKSYRLEHSVEKAKKRGIFLRDGLDCLMALTDSLEDLCRIIERGTNELGTWISGMQQSTSVSEVPEFEEEFHIGYKSLGKQNYSEYNIEDFFLFEPRSSLKDFAQNHTNLRPPRNRDLFEKVANKP